MKRKSFKISLVVLAVLCGLVYAVSQGIAASPAGSDKVLLEQNVNLSANGSASNLFVPQQTTVYFDYTVQSGKALLLMVITEEQWQAISSGEKPSGSPLLRITVSGSGTESVSLPRGTYTVALIPQSGSTQVSIKAHYRY